MSHRPCPVARLLAVGVTVAALAAPAAIARPIDSQSRPVPPDPTAAMEPEPAPPDPPIVRSVDTGFDWGSAAIGAGGAGALVALVVVGGSALTARYQIRASR
jgi:hypothetical protein